MPALARALPRILPCSEGSLLTRLLLVALLVVSSAAAQWQTAGPLRSHQAQSQAEVHLRVADATVRVSAVAPGIIRVALTPDGQRQSTSSWSVMDPDRVESALDLSEDDHQMVLTTDLLRVEIQKNPLRIRFVDQQGFILAEDHPQKGMSWTESEVRVWKRARPGEHYYGFGEKSGPLDRRGLHVTMWNSDIPGYTAVTDPLYKSVPFFYATAGGVSYGIFLDNTAWSSYDMGKEGPEEFSFGARQPTLVYYFLAGPSPREVLERYLSLVGSTPLPPLWSLGFQQCRWSYTPESRVREIARGFRSRAIPCDVLYLDIDYMDGYRIFTWNPEAFPDPAALVSDLGQQGFKVAVILDPGIKVDTAYHAYRSGHERNVFLRYPDGTLFTGDVWPGRCAFPDFTDPGTRRWWGEQFADLVATGVRGWWTDMNEPSVFDVPTKTIDRSVVHHGLDTAVTHAIAHNVYGQQMTRATADGLRAFLPDERPFILTRATFAGGQRYSSVWTGDNVASWEHLAISLRMCLGLSVSGFAFVGADIGGFIGHPTGELFARWLQLGVFTPLMRAHSQINEPNKEPWEYGEPWTSINRETITLRYRLLPFVYTLMHEASSGGSPPMRPMHYAYPHDDRFASEERQFMFGDALLVAPILDPGGTSREIRLPKGLWYDFWTGAEHRGERTIRVEAPPERIPLLVRAGAVIPMQPPVQYVGERTLDTLILQVYSAERGQDSSLYYEDDGHSFAYREGVYFQRHIVQRASEDSTTIILRESRGTFRPPARTLRIEAFGLRFVPRSVAVNAVEQSISEAGSPPTLGVWSYDRSRGALRGVLPDTSAEVVITIARERGN